MTPDDIRLIRETMERAGLKVERLGHLNTSHEMMRIQIPPDALYFGGTVNMWGLRNCQGRNIGQGHLKGGAQQIADALLSVIRERQASL